MQNSQPAIASIMHDRGHETGCTAAQRIGNASCCGVVITTITDDKVCFDANRNNSCRFTCSEKDRAALTTLNEPA